MTTTLVERMRAADRLGRAVRPANARLEIREAKSGPGTIVGYGAVFYSASDPGTRYEWWGDVEERILPGAFDRAIREDDVRGLVNHDPACLLGRTKSGTMRLAADEKGLRYEIDAPDTQVGRDTVLSVRRGDLDGSSFSFLTTDEEWVKESGKQVRLVRGVQLFDTGPVTFPAYEATTADVRTAIRESAKAALAGGVKALKRAASEMAGMLDDLTACATSCRTCAEACRASAEACDRCATACDAMGDEDGMAELATRCRDCATACRSCADGCEACASACEQMAASMRSKKTPTELAASAVRVASESRRRALDLDFGE